MEAYCFEYQKKVLQLEEHELVDGGKVVLLNAIFTNILIPYHSFYKASKAIIKKIIMLQKVFIWGGVEDKKQIDWVGQESIRWPKED